MGSATFCISLRRRTHGVMGMLDCLRAPKTLPGVRAGAAGAALCCCDCCDCCDCCVSLSSSRRNCWLFMVEAGVGLGRVRNKARATTWDRYR
jgi:hypothetical protein